MIKKNVADRTKKTNESGLVQTILLRFSSILSSCTNNFKWKWLMLRLRWWEHQRKMMMKKYCINDYHKLRRMYIARIAPKEDEKKVEYLECINCDYVFFATRKCKQIYMDLKGNNRKRQKEAFKQLVKIPTLEKVKKVGGL